MTMLLVSVAVGLGAPATVHEERVLHEIVHRSAHTTCADVSLRDKYRANYRAVRREHGRRAPGRQIWRDGLQGRPSRCRDVAKSVHVLRSMRFRGSRLLAAGPPPVPPAGSQTLHAPAGGVLARIAACESGGDPTAVNPNGHYGKYQFDQQTWESVGGTGNPAAAPEGVQDAMAAKLYAQRGSSPWECKP